MADQDVVDKIHEKKTRLQVKQEFQKRKAQERAEALALTKSQYLAEKDNPVILDVLAKAKSFAAYHTKVAQDGVGYKSNKAGEAPEIYYLTSEKRLQELDKASGMLELIDYIERQFKDLPEAAKPKTEAENPVENDDAEPLEPADNDDMVAPAA